MTASALRPQLQASLLQKLNATSTRKKNLLQQGFTLVELLIVVVILGVLSSIALPTFLNQQNKANVSAANTQGKSLMSACQVKLLDSSETIPASLTTAKTFGSITWTPSVTGAASGTALSACSSVTTGAPTTQQNLVLNVTTGNLSSEVLAQ